MGTSEVTRLLNDACQGDPQAVERLLPLVYDELRDLAGGLMARERRGHTLQPTALVHEAYLRLVGSDAKPWQGRGHFVGVAARAMRQILVNHAHARAAAKRGGHWQSHALDDLCTAFEERAADLIALDAALERLAALDPQQVKLIELRFFGGASAEEAAQLLGLSERTAEREWRIARAWLRQQLAANSGDGRGA